MRKARIWGLALAIVRGFAFYLVQTHLPHDAQWQFAYLPLWVADLPISLLYFALRIPMPYAEAIIGPIWWFFVPIIIWSLFARRKRRQK